MNIGLEIMTEKTENIEMILGDPKKAIIKLAWPTTVSMLLIVLYNLIDGIWIAGLGTNALAGLGFITPLFIIVTGLGQGIGAGSNSFIARSIGKEDKELADNGAMHTLLITIIVSIIISLIFTIFLEDILKIIGAGETIKYALDYGYVLFGGSIVFIFSLVGTSILRSEGDVHRSMYIMALTAILNMILDPIFIYWLDLGMGGAAWATIISALISSIVIFYWLFIKKNTYLSFSKNDFKYSNSIVSDILNVGLPASTEMVLISVLSMVINYILVIVSTSTSVAIFTAGWRVVDFALIPCVGLSTAIITVGGAAYGADDYKKVLISFNYTIKLGLIVSIITGIIFLLFSKYVAMIFTFSSSDPVLNEGVSNFLRIMTFFIIPFPIGIISASMFQGMGKGFESLTIAVIREIIMICSFTILFAIILGMGDTGVWWGLVVGDLIGCTLAYVWVRYVIKKLITDNQ